MSMKIIVSIHAPVWVRPAVARNLVARFRVSIHAPVWVRLLNADEPQAQKLFQFTHPCGCDVEVPLTRRMTEGFNSRTRVGATNYADYNWNYDAVSIHAPVWVRLKNALQREHICWFQFTHPCGCDSPSRFGFSLTTCFNSRTRVGATGGRAYNFCGHTVSIHAPVWVRLGHMPDKTHSPGFNSRTRVGATVGHMPDKTHSPGFNSRTRVGATGG